MVRLLLIVGIIGVNTLWGATAPTVITGSTDLRFEGEILDNENISGAVIVGDYLLIASDELKNPTRVQVLKKNGDGYKVSGSVALTAAGTKEVDLEGIAVEGDMVYVTGSHSRARKIENGVIGSTDRKEAREQFFRFKWNADGTHGPVEGPKTLSNILKDHVVLGDCRKLASKENGVDIEGLAVKNGRLHFGFRGPVLRDGWVPILTCNWSDPEGTAKVAYVQLDGRGIRDLTTVEDGFLILAGPVGDGDISYRVYFWDGVDQLSAAGSKPRLLGEFPEIKSVTDPSKTGKPEGLAVLKVTPRSYEILLVCDGLPNGKPTKWTLSR